MIISDDFDSYVRANGARLRRLAVLVAGDVDAAEDLLQTAYTRVLPRWATVRRCDQPDAYIRRVMVNARTSQWRRRRGGGEVSVAEVPEVARSRDLDGPETAALRVVVDREDLVAALRSLPPRQRTAVVLRHYCDLSEIEAAAVMACSVGTVKSNTSRGLATLRGRMAAPWGQTA